MIEKAESEMEDDREDILLGRGSGRTAFDSTFARESRSRWRSHSLSFWWKCSCPFIVSIETSKQEPRPWPPTNCNEATLKKGMSKSLAFYNTLGHHSQYYTPYIHQMTLKESRLIAAGATTMSSALCCFGSDVQHNERDVVGVLADLFPSHVGDATSFWLD